MNGPDDAEKNPVVGSGHDFVNKFDGVNQSPIAFPENEHVDSSQHITSSIL
jgi:hypothetical protein